MTTLANARPGQRRSLWSRIRSGEAHLVLFFLLPASIGLVAFYLWPAIRGAYLSFTDYNVLSDPTPVGLANYQRLLGDDLFWNSLGVTAVYVVINIGVQTIVAVLLALLLHRATSSTLVRGIALMPYFVANVVVALVWYFMLDYQVGIVNQMLTWLGIDPVAFFGDPELAVPTIAMINVWRHAGYTALLVFAGLQAINPSVYEAADLDGAGERAKFFRITLPLLRPILAMVLVITVTGSFQVFDTVSVTTNGGPVNATRVIYLYIYNLAFGQLDFGYASAISVVLFLLLAGVAFLQIKLLRSNQTDLD
ncbi:sugar ABC transporter permease [Galbitalea sp. SE-J8]|uniref:carbohydrate ABC transporter permease n=1 Tax=Galbitalea sp. SE-J8 TaxID=3054952 RepID=UPI00259CF3BD|nr:sugar ABC transporter permease [Galbitalea sp. SE-J8]MDM4764287.1 sugar ABC transporter permease [Galbitalea sp. SE-J8]